MDSVNSYERIIKKSYIDQLQHYHNSINNHKFPYEKCQKRNEAKKYQINIVGNLVTKEYIICCDLAMRLYKNRKRLFEKPILNGLYQLDWLPYRYQLNCQLPQIYKGQSHVSVVIDNEHIGDERLFIKWVNKRFRIRHRKDYRKQGMMNLLEFFNLNSNRSFVHLYIRMDSIYIGTLIFMLYDDICPETCREFLRLCRKPTHGLNGTPIHRVVPDCWIQGGGFVLEKSPKLFIENFIINHNRRGVLSMSTCCYGVSRSFQFVVTLGDQSWMNQRYVAFGQLLSGESVLRKIETVENVHDSPVQHIHIIKVSIHNEVLETDELAEKVNLYLADHIEDIYESINMLLDEIFLSFEIEIENKNIQNEGDVHISPKTSDKQVAKDASLCGVCVREAVHSKTTNSSFAEETKRKKLYYLPFTNVIADDDPIHEPPLIISPVRTQPKQDLTLYRQRANKIMSDWLKLTQHPKVYKDRRERDTPFQKLLKKKALPDCDRLPTVNDFYKKATVEAFFTMSCHMNFSKSNSSDERFEKRKRVINEAGFSKMAMVFDKTSMHRRVSYNYFAPRPCKSDLSLELIRMTSIRVAEYASQRPCFTVTNYIEKNKVKYLAKELIEKEEKEKIGKRRSLSHTKNTECTCCLLPRKICTCD